MASVAYSMGDRSTSDFFGEQEEHFLRSLRWIEHVDRRSDARTFNAAGPKRTGIFEVQTFLRIVPLAITAKNKIPEWFSRSRSPPMALERSQFEIVGEITRKTVYVLE